MKSNKKYYHLIITILIVLALVGLEGYKRYQQNHQLSGIDSKKVEEVIQTSQSTNINSTKSSKIPQKAYDVWNFVRVHHQAMKGYVGGREFKNLEHHLEMKASDGHRIHYQEWDVNPKREGQNRGAERLVTSDEDRAWYTSNHYQSFTELN